MVVSPGVPWQAPELVAARAAGVPVIGELELGVRYIKGPVAAITGTKGKSTTTAALGAMLREAGRDVRVGGNIGEAVTGLLEGATADTAFVLEVSSFQLEGTDSLHPKVAVFLNLSADHLDRHASFEEYAAAKARIFANQTAADFAVVNGDDPAVMAAGARRARAGGALRDRPATRTRSSSGRRPCSGWAGTKTTCSTAPTSRSPASTSPWTCWPRPPPPASWAPRRRRSAARSPPSTASSTSWSAWR